MIQIPIVLFMFVYLIYVTQFHLTVYHTLSLKYRKIKALKSLVATQYNNIFVIFWISLRLIAKSIYIQLWQYCNKSIRKIDKNTYEVLYVINGVLYTMVLKPKRGPKCIIEAVDGKDNDMTYEIISYLGPSENFHGAELTPKYFNKNKITLSMSSGDEVSFEENDVLKI